MEIFRDSSQQLPMKIYVNRTLTDADTLPTVSLKLNGVALSSHTVTKESTGVYVTQLKFADTFEEGELEATWTYTVSTEPIVKIETHTVVTPYVDVESLYELPHSDEEIRLAERYARSQIESYTGQSFGRRRSWIRVQGKGTDLLILPEHLIAATHVYENGTLVWEFGEIDNTIDGIEVTPSGFALRITEREDPIEHSIAGVMYHGGRFVEDYTYEVMGEFGYLHVPANVVMCGNMLVEDFFCKEKAWRIKYAQKVSSGDFTVDINQRVFSGTGNSVVDAILSDYMWHRMVVV